MSQRHPSRREFVTGVGLGIAGLSIGGGARADGLFGRRSGRRRRNTSRDPWEMFEPMPVHGDTTDYGFVVKHHAYWGLPIPGYENKPEPYVKNDKATEDKVSGTFVGLVN